MKKIEIKQPYLIVALAMFIVICTLGYLIHRENIEIDNLFIRFIYNTLPISSPLIAFSVLATIRKYINKYNSIKKIKDYVFFTWIILIVIVSVILIFFPMQQNKLIIIDSLAKGILGVSVSCGIWINLKND